MNNHFLLTSLCFFQLCHSMQETLPERMTRQTTKTVQVLIENLKFEKLNQSVLVGKDCDWFMAACLISGFIMLCPTDNNVLEALKGIPFAFLGYRTVKLLKNTNKFWDTIKTIESYTKKLRKE